jgi:hypothetical protein
MDALCVCVCVCMCLFCVCCPMFRWMTCDKLISRPKSPTDCKSDK